MTTSLAPPPDDPAQLDLLTRAAVRISFDLSTFAAHEDFDDLTAFLDSSCELVQTPSGSTVWSLTDEERRRCFAQVPVSRLRAARDVAEGLEEIQLQTTLDQSLAGGWTKADLEALTPEEARALSVVAAWWDGHRADVPDVATATLLTDRLNLFAGLRAMAADHFVGRWDMLHELQTHFRSESPEPFSVYGIGGIGKSALVARHVVWAIDRQPGAYAAMLDFDDPMLNPLYQLEAVHRIISVVARQTDGRARERLDRLTKVALDAAETVRFRGETSSRATGSGRQAEVGELLSDLIAFTDGTILVVFDTVEQVQRRGPSAVGSFGSLVDRLGQFSSRIRVLVSGRTSIPGMKGKPHELGQLDRVDAVGLLRDLCTRPVEPRTAEAVIDALGASPLTVRLTARLLSDPDTVPGDLLILDLHAERINAELYRRVLDSIKDEEVQRLAHPGLVLRRITRELIQHVLAGPCEVAVPDTTTADNLFERLALEGMLVDRTADGEALVHRADIRRVMLPQLLADRRDVANRIQRAAVRYYAKRSDPASRTEELYHRLMLEQTPATLVKRWNPLAAVALVGVLDELPTPSRVYLTRQLPETYLSEEDRRLLGDTQWSEEIQPQVERFLAASDGQQALRLLAERRGPDGSSLLPGLEIEALELVGDLPRAIAIARDQRRAAAIANDLSGVTTFTLHLARLQERSGDGATAVTTLEEALQTVRGPTVDRLRLLVAMLGLWRRRGYPLDSEEYHAHQVEADELQGTLGDRQIRRVPGLLRDLVAEVSAIHPTILDNALGTIGIDASPDGLVPDALRELDDSMAAERGTPGLVADVVQLDRFGDTVDWESIATRPRGETGKALLQVFQAFGSSADPVRSAVAADYQDEADAALLGYQVNVAHKA